MRQREKVVDAMRHSRWRAEVLFVHKVQAKFQAFEVTPRREEAPQPSFDSSPIHNGLIAITQSAPLPKTLNLHDISSPVPQVWPMTRYAIFS